MFFCVHSHTLELWNSICEVVAMRVDDISNYFSIVFSKEYKIRAQNLVLICHLVGNS